MTLLRIKTYTHHHPSAPLGLSWNAFSIPTFLFIFYQIGLFKQYRDPLVVKRHLFHYLQWWLNYIQYKTVGSKKKQNSSSTSELHCCNARSEKPRRGENIRASRDSSDCTISCHHTQRSRGWCGRSGNFVKCVRLVQKKCYFLKCIREWAISEKKKKKIHRWTLRLLLLLLLCWFDSRQLFLFFLLIFFLRQIGVFDLCGWEDQEKMSAHRVTPNPGTTISTACARLGP